jgi:glutamate-5-semialdehyde dehydrogenase
VSALLQLDAQIDLVIPRGGESLIRAVAEQSRIPVLKHYKGVCHVYVDRAADLEMALSIIENAKCSRPGVCNAAETLLVHKDVADAFLPGAAKRLTGRGVELRADERARSLLPGSIAATDDDWSTEHLDLILAVGVVDSLAAAIDHINRFGTHHSDAIVTSDQRAADQFTQRVDSATVYVNASTRFTDGFEFGLGAEIGISTDKLHARGPCGIEELTTYKYVLEGAGHIRA